MYKHTKYKHNTRSAEAIAPVIYHLFKPNSIIDVGCGLGSFLRVFKEQGVKTICGIDGPWCNKQLLYENIDKSEFKEHNLENSLQINQKFDLAISLEVAEHLSPGRANSFVNDLTKLSDTILFSAAVPYQGGDNHFNEQWIDYWEQIFKEYKYSLYDIVRPIIWDNDNIFWWYRQNIVLFIKDGSETEKVKNFNPNIIKNIIHPDLYTTINNYKDKNALKRYIKLLSKAILYRFGIQK